MHSSPSFIRNLKQARCSLLCRDRESEFRLRICHFSPFLILSQQQASPWSSNFYGRVLTLTALICYNNSLSSHLHHEVANSRDFCGGVQPSTRMIVFYCTFTTSFRKSHIIMYPHVSNKIAKQTRTAKRLPFVQIQVARLRNLEFPQVSLCNRRYVLSQ